MGEGEGEISRACDEKRSARLWLQSIHSLSLSLRIRLGLRWLGLECIVQSAQGIAAANC